MTSELTHYAKLLADIKARIQAAQTRSVLAVNAELIRLYWGIGRLLDERQAAERWGAGVIPRLANDLRNELPELKGFSSRNLDRMLAFARAYPEPGEFSPQAVAKSLGGPPSPQPVAKSTADSLLWQLPWGHHALLLEKVKPVDERRWYIAQTLAHLAPERVGGLILSGSWLRPNHYMSGYFGARREIIGTNPEAYAATSVLCAYPPAWIEANWHVYEAALATAPLTAAQQEVMRERIDALLTFDGRDQMAALTVPVLVLGARDDMVVPAFLQEEIVAALPGCAKTMLDTGGHLFPVSRPDAFTATVADWISRLA